MPLVFPTSNYILPFGQSLIGSDQPGVYVFQTPPMQWPSIEIDGAITLSIANTINTCVFYPDAIVFDGSAPGGGALTIGPSAVITVTASDHATGIYGSTTPDILNRGQILVTATSAALGIVSFDTGHHVDNSGLIRITSAHSARAVWLDGHSDFTNSGTIEAIGGTGNTVTDGLEIYRFDADITNSGTISATDNDPAFDTFAITIDSWTTPHTFTNSGTVKGDVALFMSNPGFPVVDTVVNSGTMIGKVMLGNGQTVLQNSGHILGAVDLGTGADTYNGAGGTLDTPLHGGAGDDSIAGGAGGESLLGDAGNDTISGAAGDDTLDGGAGNNLLDGGAGVDAISFASATSGVTVDLISGTATRADGQDTISNVESLIGSSQGDVLHGGGGDTIMAGAGNDTVADSSGQNYLRGEEGDDSISGGSGFDDSNGNMGNDTIHGNAGDDYSVGGKDNDLLFGDDGNDIVWGNLGNDTCDGGNGNDQCRGGQGDDSVSGRAGDDFISGDRGNDTVSGGPGADLFHTFSGAGIDKVLDFNLAEGDRVMVDPGTVYTVSQVGSDTVIDMGNGDQMILVGVQMSTLTPGWIFGA